MVLKLASLGMFSFSLGQTMLCLGRNKTSCESHGYNACDYQVLGLRGAGPFGRLPTSVTSLPLSSPGSSPGLTFARGWG